MFTLDIKKGIKYIIFSIFLIIFNYIYSFFSHDVSSYYMTYMFLIPLIFGIVSILIKGNKIFKNTFPSSMISYVFYMLLMGVFEIAGTGSSYTIILLYLGHILLAISLISLFMKEIL